MQNKKGDIKLKRVSCWEEIAKSVGRCFPPSCATAAHSARPINKKRKREWLLWELRNFFCKNNPSSSAIQAGRGVIKKKWSLRMSDGHKNFVKKGGAVCHCCMAINFKCTEKKSFRESEKDWTITCYHTEGYE